jgi:hypothetical protein
MKVNEDGSEWINPRFLDRCRRVRHIQWCLPIDIDFESIDESILIRWSYYAENNVLFPNLVTVTHLWYSLSHETQEDILTVNKITANTPVRRITVDVEASDLLWDEEPEIFIDYTKFVYDFIANLPSTITSLEMSHQCNRRNSVLAPLPNTFTPLGSLRYLDIRWYMFNEELVTLASLPHLESLAINLSSDNLLPSVTYPSLQNLDIVICHPCPQKCGIVRLKMPRLRTITCRLENPVDAEDLIEFAGLLGGHKQIRDIALLGADKGVIKTYEASVLVKVLEKLPHAHAITLRMKFVLKLEDKGSIEAACGSHLSELRLPKSRISTSLLPWLSSRFPGITDWNSPKML